MLRHFSAIMLSLPLYAMAVTAPYAPDFKGGIIPPDISVSNGNSLLPDADGYKRGWTADGWTVDRYGNRGYVAVSPTYTGSDLACENVLSLPELEIGQGCFLSWQALSVHPDFPEAYRVEITADGSTTVLFQTATEQAQWATRMADLSAYAGKQAVISFVCTSCNRYMLALDAIKVEVPSGLSIEARDLSTVYHGPAESAEIKIEALNTGAAISAGYLQLSAADGYIESLPLDGGEWLAGTARTFTLHAPLSLDATTDYEVCFVPTDGGEALTLSKNSIYSSTFAKRLFVDKGTGMWCVNCPEGILRMEELERRFGSALIPLDTHCTTGTPASDPLANDAYFAELDFRAVPQLMLDRIRSTAASNDALFADHYFTPAEFSLQFTGLTLSGNDSAELTISVKSANTADNNTDRYRIGYVLSADIHEPDNNAYYQRNNCTQPSAERFFYLPSRIPSALCVFHNVTLNSATAFSGIENSLPANLEPGQSYSYSFSIERPELIADINRLRVAAFVLDCESSRIMGSEALRLEDADFAGLPAVVRSDNDGPTLNVSADGILTICQATPAAYSAEIYSIEGALCAVFRGNGAESSHVLDLPHGLYVLQFKANGRICSKKITL